MSIETIKTRQRAGVVRKSKLAPSYNVNANREIENLKAIIRCSEAYVRAIGRPDYNSALAIEEAEKLLRTKGYKI